MSSAHHRSTRKASERFKPFGIDTISVIIFLFLASTILIAFSGCTPSSQFITLSELVERRPDKIQVSTKEGRVFELTTYSMGNKELIGSGFEVSLQGKKPFSGTIPSTSIVSILEMNANSGASPFLLVLLVILGLLGLLFLIALFSSPIFYFR